MGDGNGTEEAAVRIGPRATRRGLLHATAGFGAAVAAAALPGRMRAAAATLADVEAPPELGQSGLTVYVPETGHTLTGAILDYWRVNGGADAFGQPVSEPFAAPNGLYSQAFERGVLQYRPEYLFTTEPIVRLMPIHAYLLDGGADGSRLDGRRERGGGDRRVAPWEPRAPESKAVAKIVSDGGVFVPETGQTIAGPFLDWYRRHEGEYYLGHPVTRQITEGGVQAQLFEGGSLIESDEGARLARLDDRLLTRIGADAASVPQGGLPAFDERLFWLSDNPAPEADAAGPGRKRIEVSLGQQRMWAYRGDTLVLTSLVSTGLEPNVTAPGEFRVRLKLLSQTMKGFTNSSGEVAGFGDAKTADDVTYEVPDVPHVMYFNMDAEALHGAYWHENFGNPMSHGCINLPLDVATFLYGWAPLGVAVSVRQ